MDFEGCISSLGYGLGNGYPSDDACTIEVGVALKVRGSFLGLGCRV